MDNTGIQEPLRFNCNLDSKPDEEGSIVPVLAKAVNSVHEGRTVEISASTKPGSTNELDVHPLEEFMKEITEPLGVMCSVSTICKGHYLVVLSPK